MRCSRVLDGIQVLGGSRKKPYEHTMDASVQSAGSGTVNRMGQSDILWTVDGSVTVRGEKDGADGTVEVVGVEGDEEDDDEVVEVSVDCCDSATFFFRVAGMLGRGNRRAVRGWRVVGFEAMTDTTTAVRQTRLVQCVQVSSRVLTVRCCCCVDGQVDRPIGR